MEQDVNQLILDHLERTYKTAGIVARRFRGLDKQEVMSTAHTKLVEAAHRFTKGGCPFWGYVRHSIEGGIRDLARRRVKSCLPYRDCYPNICVDQTEHRILIQQILGQLTERESRVLIQHDWQGYTQRHIAEQLGVSESRVCQIRRSLLDKLRKRQSVDEQTNRPRFKQFVANDNTGDTP